MAQTVKNPPVMREAWVRSLHREDPLEKGMATHSSILAWRIPGIEESVGYNSQGHKEIQLTNTIITTVTVLLPGSNELAQHHFENDKTCLFMFSHQLLTQFPDKNLCGRQQAILSVSGLLSDLTNKIKVF